MPPKCYICNFYDPKRMSLYRIPDRNDEYSDRSRLWLKLLEESTTNIDRIRICSDHFLKKKPAKSGDCFDIDWVPNKNLGRFAKNQKLIDYYFKKKKLVNQPDENLNRFEGAESQETSAINNTTDRPLCSETNLTEKPISPKEKNLNRFEGDKPRKISAANEAARYLCAEPDFRVESISLKETNRIDGAKLQKISATTTGDDGPDFCENVNTTLRNPCGAPGPFSNQIVLFTKNGPIPLKKKRIYVEKLDEVVFFTKEIQTELSCEDVDMLFKHFREAEEERNELLIKISNLTIDVDFFKGNDKKSRFYTGLTTWTLFNNFFDMVKSYLPTHFNCKLSKFQMVALTLMKLRLNLSFTDLGYRFQVSVSTASRYFHRCIFIFFKLFSGSKLIHWPQDRSNLLMNTPSYFQSLFKERITIIVDCFEIFIQSPSVLLAAAQGFSQYKHHITLKFLIGISVTGVIIFISCGFGGRASDKKISMESGFMNNIEEGDLVLADKGFLIEEELKEKEAHLKMPCFVKNQNQLNPYQIEQSRHLSSVRIHVERIISLIRGKFNICSDLAKMSAVAKQNDLFDRDLYDKMVYTCCCLANLCPSVVSSDFEI